MLTPTEREQLVQICSAIGNEVATDDGFVSVRNLLARFQTHLYVRPLLVEGMLARVSRHGGQNTGWAVLVDSETYPIDSLEIEHESSTKPLPFRFRNTVAHELVHSLAFRTSELGVRLQSRSDKSEDTQDLVNDIEEETEALSPLLLLPEKSLAKLLSSRRHSLSIEDVVRISQTMGLSRPALIGRLRLIPPTDNYRFRQSDALKNLGVGIAEWLDGKVAILRKWPLFLNFERNIFPDFLMALSRQDISAVTVVADKNFGMCGGWTDKIEIETGAGVSGAPSAHKISVQISMEWVERAPGQQFFFIVKKTHKEGL